MRVVRSPAGASRAVELQALIRTEGEQAPFLMTRDADGRQLLIVLEPDDERLWIGRGVACDLVIDWDWEVSRVHAELSSVAGDWAISDDGISRNGTFVDGERTVGRRRLRDGDRIRIGDTALVFRAPRESTASTRPAEGSAPVDSLTPMQRKVLVSLCRPLWGEQASALPATNRAIAEELVLSTETVRTHMRSLFAAFGIEGLPQNEKRARLVLLAIEAGVIPRRDDR